MPGTGGSATAAGCAFGPWGCVAGAAVDVGTAVASAPGTPSGILSSPFNGAPSYADQGNWTVATGKATARNSGAATATQKAAGSSSPLSTATGYDKYLIFGLGLLALAMAWKTLKH